MNIAKYIDHTLLKSEATLSDLKEHCNQAKVHDFHSVCVNGSYVKKATYFLENTDVLVCSVIGFPLGVCTTQSKVFEAKHVVEQGAKEIDMVMHVGALKDGYYDYVLEDIKEVVDSVNGKALVKVILENCLLTKSEIETACNLCVGAGAHYVKTSTGFNRSGADIEDVQRMKKAVNGKALVKAAGGIRDYATALSFIEAGADRLGLSASVEIMKGMRSKSDY